MSKLTEPQRLRKNTLERAAYKRRMLRRGYVAFVDRTPTWKAIVTACHLQCSFIMLGHGHFALVDREDYESLNQHRWTKHKKGYAVRMAPSETRRQVGLKMHRVILCAKAGQLTDHRNRNKLDNRRSNLRFGTVGQNNMNKGKRNQKRAPTSRFKGVSFDRRHGKWFAQLRRDGEDILKQRFDTEEAAAIAYNAVALKEFGEFAVVNQL